MIICGLQIGNEPSACVINNGKLIYYNEERKIRQNKKVEGTPFACLEEIIKYKVDKFVVSTYNFIPEELFQLESYLKYKKVLQEDQKVFCLFNTHHITHAIKAFIDSGFKKARVFVIDGRGSDWYLSDKTQTYETSSVYDFDKKSIKCIFKKLFLEKLINRNVFVNYTFNPDSNKTLYKYLPKSVDEGTQFEITDKLDLGHFYQTISNHFNFKDEEGKFMGYQSYGKFDKNIFSYFKQGLVESSVYKIERNYDVAKTAQIYFEHEYLKLVERFKTKNMVFTGGTGLNVVNNYKIKKHFNKSNLWFDPLCADVGNSIGAAYSYLFLNNLKIKKLNNLFIGSEIKVKKSNTSINSIINLLKKGKVVGLVQGKAEAGPRALGNRSLLLDPTLKNAKDIMNQIKKRESFRPFACSVLEEKVSEYFEIQDKSPYMMYAPQATKKAKKLIPSLIHVDNTCRVQTINKVNNPFLYNLLKNFKIPILMNTSFNLAGFPIIEKYEDIIFCLKNSTLEYVYFSDYKFLLKNEKKK